MAQTKSISDFLNKFKRFDVFTKPLEDFQEKTLYGGFVTVICWVMICYVIVYECYDYMKITWEEEIFVDTSTSPKLQMYLDIVIPRISCDYLSLDAADSSGDQHLHIDFNIYKRRLDLNGKPIDEGQKESLKKKSNELSATTPLQPAENKTCASCYGAETEKLKCCNTCTEVREAYRNKNWAFHPEKFEQCKTEVEVNKTTVFQEGCQIYGTIEVNRVGGSFHIAPGHSFSINYIHVHDVHPFSSDMFNTTHIIKHLSFGNKLANDPLLEGIQIHPLDDHVGFAEDGSMMFHYFIKLIPTLLQKNNNYGLHTNQFSVTKFSKKSRSKSDGGSSMPGIFFSYELSPLMVKRTEMQKSVGHLITVILSDISGIYIAAMLVDAILHRTIKYVRKLEIGKSE